MGDFLVNLGANPGARSVVKKLGLPLPLPQKLVRGRGPLLARPIDGKTVWVGGVPDGYVESELARVLPAAGAEVGLFGGNLAVWSAAAEAWGRSVTAFDDVPESVRPHALVFDATGITSVAQLDALHDFFHPRVRSVATCGRVVVVARPADEAPSAAAAAVRRGLPGFVKSLAKELGAKGITVNLLTVALGAEDQLAGPLRFLLSVRSAYITGQQLDVDGVVDGPVLSNPDALVRPLSGKVALVTGAARGIGRKTAQRLAEEGAKVVVLDRPADDAALSEVAQLIGGLALPCDVTDPDAGERIATFLADQTGGVDIVVHNAGVTRDKTLGRMDRARWDLVLDVNLDAILLVQGVLEERGVLHDGGRVVVLSSIGGIAGNPGQTNYGLTKAALIGWVDHHAPALAARGITVNAVAPGFIETRLTDAIPAATREVARRLSALAQGGQPVDIAEGIVFFASPASVGITGRVLRICGLNFVGA